MLGFGRDEDSQYSYSFENPFSSDYNIYGYPEDGLEFADVLKQLTGGFIQGFTTIDLVEEDPDHWLESLAKGVGYFAGFVGIIPGVGTLASFGTKAGVRGISASVKILGKVAGKELSEQIVTKGMQGLRHVTQPVVTKYAIQTRSIPFYAADAIMGLGKKMLANTPAEALVKKMLVGKQGRRVLVEDIAEASIRMGLASGVASWQGGVDQMMSSFVSGAAFGGLDRGIANMAGKIAKDSQMVRAITGMISNGLPSTLTDQPLEIQIFDYITGAWFGSEMPYAQRKALEVLTGPSGVTSSGKKRYEALLNPEENIPEYKNADELYGNKANEVREEILNQSRAWLGASMGQTRSGYVSQMLAASWFKEKYDPLFEKYVAEGKSSAEADRMAKDDIRKSDEILALIKSNDQIHQQIVSGKYTDAQGNIDVTQANDAQRKLIEMNNGFTRSKSDKKVDGSIPRDLSNADLIDISPDEEQGFSLESLINRISTEDVQRISDTIEKTGERLDETLISLDPKIQEGTIFEGITPESFGIRPKDVQTKVGGDINGSIVQTVNDPLDRNVIDQNIPIAPDVVPLQRNPRVKNPSKEAIESTATGKIDDPGLVLDAITTAKEDARQDLDPLQQKNLTPIEYVAREFVVKDNSIPLDKREDVYAQIIKDATVDYDNYVAGNIKDVNSKSEFADYFVSKYAKNLKLLEKERKEYAARIVQTLRKMDNSAINQFVVDPTNRRLVNRNELSGNGTSIMVSRAPGQDARVLGKIGKNVYSVRYVENVRKGKIDTYDPPEGIMKYFKSSKDMLWIHHVMMNEGKALMGHVKSNGELIYYDAITLKENEGSNEGFIERTLNEIDDKSFSRYKKAKDEYVEKVFEQLYRDKVIDPVKIQETKLKIAETYDKYVVSQIKLHTEVFNPGIKLAEINKKGFVNNFLAMNKRMQLIHSEGHWADKQEFASIKKSPESNESIDSFRYVILSSANKTTQDGKVLSKKEGVPDDFFNVLDSDGKIKSVVSETSTDGAVIVRQDVFDSMVKDGGYDPDSGVIKSVIAGDEASGNGMLLSKHAMFRAGRSQDDFMKKNNIHMILRDTSAKQYGKRNVYDNQLLSSNEMVLYKRGTNEQVSINDPDVVYEMPIDAVSYNLSTREDINSSLSDQVIVSQLLRNLHIENTSSDFIRDLYNETIQSGIDGDVLENAQMRFVSSELMSSSDPKSLKKKVDEINVDKLGLQQITDIIYGGEGGDIMYDHVIRHILNKDIKEDPTGFVDDAEFTQRNLSGAERIILSLSDTNIVFDSAIISNKNLDGYVSAKILSYYNTKINNPETPYSLKSIGLPTDEFNRGLIKEGEFMLGEGAKNMKVKSKALDKDVTLSKLWDTYQDALNTNQDGSKDKLIEDLQEDLRMIVIRVPSDSISGARSLMFKGFYDNRGTGIALHSQDMASLGGMDLDIDSTFVYQNLGKGEYGRNKESLHDVLLENKDQWVEEVVRKEPLWRKTYKNWANDASVRFSIFSNEVLRKNQIKELQENTDKLIKGGNKKVAVFAEGDLNNKQYKPFIEKLKQNGFKQVEGREWLFTKDGISPEDLYKQISSQEYYEKDYDFEKVTTTTKRATSEDINNLKQLTKGNPELTNILYNTFGVSFTNDKGRPCAKQGIRATSFTRGSTWEIVKDLKDYPSHQKGGVDISIDNTGVSIVKKDGAIKAEFGLLIPNIMTVTE